MCNVGFRKPDKPSHPVFDWVTFDDIVETHDRTLQESIAQYDPETQVLVFVFLLSASGNSCAMWRRKLPVPNNILRENQEEVTKVTKAVAKRKYVMELDE
jgi:hypothetical protein